MAGDSDLIRGTLNTILLETISRRPHVWVRDLQIGERCGRKGTSICVRGACTRHCIGWNATGC